MKIISKALVGTIAAGAMAVTTATPAQARGVDVGDVISGAQIIGGIAAVAGAVGPNRGYGGRSQVTDIRNIDQKRDGYTVKGRIAVNTRNSNWQRGWNNDYRGYTNAYRGYDSGTITCKVRYGQVVDLDYNGVRGLG